MLEQPKKEKPRIAPLTKKWFISPIIIGLLIFLALALGGAGGYFYYQKTNPKNNTILGEKENVYLAFTEEIYNKIQENHWKKISDEELTNLFLLATEKLTGQPQNPKEKNKKSLFDIIENILSQIDEEKTREEFIVQLNNLVLNNLEPFGRSHLYSQKDEQTLSDTVRNISDQDHYQNLEINKEASSEEIAKAYQNLTKRLAQTDTPEAQEKLAQVSRAYQVLGDKESRQQYDVSGIEPTMSYNLIGSNIFHIHLTKFSPTTFDELQRVTEKVHGQSNVDTLIFDLRDNIGGSIDGLPYFLGPFIGQDQYAYQFFHQDEKTDYKTRTGWLPGLVQYKKVIVLINEFTQSSAEIAASVLKKYNVGTLVGTTTRGWGTVEKVFKLENQISENETYSVFLVHSLTLREDSQPIEGLGVDPDIFVSGSNWRQELYSYFPDQNIINAIAKILANDQVSPETSKPSFKTDEPVLKD